MEVAISDLYAQSPEIAKWIAKYRTYMRMVDKRTKLARERFLNEQDEILKAKYQKAYREALEGYTTGSLEYERLIAGFSYALAEVNQQALDIVNGRMAEIYMLNYNQVAEQCKEVGIEVRNG